MGSGFLFGKEVCVHEKEAHDERWEENVAGRRVQYASGELQAKKLARGDNQALQGLLCAVQKIFF